MFDRKRLLALPVSPMLLLLSSAASFSEVPAPLPRPLEAERAGPPVDVAARAAARPSEALLRSLESATLRDAIAEVLERNPEVAHAEQMATAARARAPQVGALPDPVATLTAFALPAETRVGPQRLSAAIQQQFPGFGTLPLRHRAASLAAAAAGAESEAIRLDKLTEARRTSYELAFLDAQGAVLSAERETLVRYEAVSQARYAAGTGLQQEIVRIQAQITRTDTRLLEISERRSTLTTAFNALRDRSADAPIGPQLLPERVDPALDLAALRRLAAIHRPELTAAGARIAAAAVQVELAEKSFRPEITLGLSYTAVGRREDAPGRLSPPPDDGDDILALTASLNLPVRRRRLESGVVEAHALLRAAEERGRHIAAEIEAATGDLVARIPQLEEHLELLETVLFRQAKEVLRSTETAYSTGKLNAVDLLDAEVVLFDVQISAARTRADLAIALAELDRAIAYPVELSGKESIE